MSYVPVLYLNNEIADVITEIENNKTFLEKASISEDGLTRMQSRSFLLESHHTTHIEGTKLTIDESKKILKGIPVRGADKDDVQELLNYRKAFEYVDLYMNSGCSSITENLILGIHKYLVEGVRYNYAKPGEYRRVQNYVVDSFSGEVVYMPPSHFQVRLLMKDFVNWLNDYRDIHPIVASGIAQYKLAYIHPFIDGNGRVSRILSLLCLYKAGYKFKRLLSISEYYDRNRTEFYTFLGNAGCHRMGLTEWVEFYAKSILVQLENVKKLVKLEIRKESIERDYNLSKRQACIMLYTLGQGTFSIAEVQDYLPEISRRTIQRDMKVLVDRGLILRLGNQNAGDYVWSQEVYESEDTK